MRVTSIILIISILILATSIMANYEQYGTINFSWDANSEDENIVEYRLYMSDTQGVYNGNDYISIPYGTEVYQYNELDLSKKMYFSLKAVNEFGILSPCSNEIIYIPPSEPQGFNITSIEYSQG